MAEQKIKLHVQTDGRTRIEAEGFVGGTCMEATAAFESMFSGVATPRQATGECDKVARDDGERVNV